MKITARELRALIASVAISSYKRKRLGNCEAWVIDCHDKGIKVLMSYDTFVAYYDTEYSGVVVFDYYSPTTTQHTWKFIKEMNDKYGVVFIQFPYERKDHLIQITYYDNHEKVVYDYLKYSEEDAPYVSKRVRAEMSKNLRKRIKDDGYDIYLSVPLPLIDEHVLETANAESYEQFVNRYYRYTVW